MFFTRNIKNSGSKLHRQSKINLILFSYKIEACIEPLPRATPSESKVPPEKMVKLQPVVDTLAKRGWEGGVPSWVSIVSELFL